MKQLFTALVIVAVLLVALAAIGPSLPGGNPVSDFGRWLAGGFGGGYR